MPLPLLLHVPDARVQVDIDEEHVVYSVGQDRNRGCRMSCCAFADRAVARVADQPVQSKSAMLGCSQELGPDVGLPLFLLPLMKKCGAVIERTKSSGMLWRL